MSAPDYTILDFKKIEKEATPENPFEIIIEVTSATKGQYSGYLIRARAYFKVKDAKRFTNIEELAIAPGKVTPVTFFTKTTLETQWQNQFGEDWPTVIRGHTFQLSYQGKAKSDKGREMHLLYARVVDMPEQAPTAPPEE